MARKTTAYSNNYIEKCFTVWYSSGRPAKPKVLRELLSPDEYGRTPLTSILRKWMIKYGWETHADELDAKALEIRDDFLVNKKANILQKQAIDAYAIAEKAMIFMISGTFDTSASAVNAYFRATEELRKVVGISETIEKIGKMTNEQLEKEILEKLRQATEAGQIIEGEEIEETEDYGDTQEDPP